MNKGTVFKDIDLNNLKEGQRYTVTKQHGEIMRGTLSRIIEPNRRVDYKQLIFDFDGRGRMNIPANSVARIQQYNVGPNEDTGGLINEYIGGRRRRTRKKTRRKKRKKKTKKRRRKKKTKRRRRKRKRTNSKR